MRFCLLAIAIVSPALTPLNPSANAHGTYIFAGKLLNVESGELLTDQVIIIQDERIAEIKRSADDLNIPDDAGVIDLRGLTVLPGLIDAHVHLLADANEHGYRRLRNSVPRATVKGVNNARITLEAGFTSARVVGSPGFGDVALRDGIRAGEVPGPRLLVAGPGITITGGHMDNNLLPVEYQWRETGVADGPWAVRVRVRHNIKYGVDLIKVCSTGGVLSKGTKVGAPQFTVEELKAIVEEAHSRGCKVACHAHGARGIKNAIRAGVDSVEHASLIDDEGIRLAKENGTILVMDIYCTEYILSEGEKAGILAESLEKERQVGKAQRESFRKAHRAGVRIAFGTDAAVFPHGQNARQFSRMVQFGMTPLEAIRSATLEAAELLGTDADVRPLKVGKYADLIAVDGNPLENVSLLEKVGVVVKGGRVVKQRSGGPHEQHGRPRSSLMVMHQLNRWSQKTAFGTRSRLAADTDVGVLSGLVRHSGVQHWTTPLQERRFRKSLRGDFWGDTSADSSRSFVE